MFLSIYKFRLFIFKYVFYLFVREKTKDEILIFLCIFLFL